MHTTYVATKDLFEALVWNKRCFGRRDEATTPPLPTVRSSGEEAWREPAPPAPASREPAPASREPAPPESASR